MSASSSESGGKEKPPDQSRKKRRSRKTPPKFFEPTEEASSGPNEKAVVNNTATEEAAAAEEAAAEKDAVTATVAAKKAAAAAAVARETAAKEAGEAKETAKETESAEVAKASSSTAAPAGTLIRVEAIPKLMEVVKAASAITPAPRTTMMRPSLSDSRKTPGPPTAVRGSAGLVEGLSYAQQVSGNSKKSRVIEIQGKYVAPRQPPSGSGKPRPKSDGGLQGLFDGRWQDERYGMCFEQIRGSSQGAYLEAICAVIPHDDIFSFGALDRGMAELYTTSLESATKLMLEGIEVGGRHLTPFPVSIKPTRVVFSRVPMRADNEDLLSFLRMFGKVHGKVRAIPLKIGDKGLGRGIFSTSREAYVTLNQGCKLPDGFYLNILGSRSYIEVSTEAKCYACHQVGHFIADCPKRTRKAAESTAKGASTTVGTPGTVTLSDAAPSPVEQPTMTAPHIPPQEAKKVAGIASPSMREEASSSDEEQFSKPGKKNMTKRKSKKAPQESTPPLSASESAKRRRSDEGLASSSLRRPVLSTDSIAPLSGSEMLTLDEEEGPTEGGYESCGSTVSIGSRFEMAPSLKGVEREKLRSILDRLHYKKNPEVIWSILKQELGDPLRILPQLLILLKESKRRRKYAEASRIERLHRKILEISEERKLDDCLRQ